MADLSRCSSCASSVSGELILLWDNRCYCRRCVENASPELSAIVSSGGSLEETVSPEDVRAWTYLSHVGKPVLLVISLVFGLPLAIAIWSGDANTIQGIAGLLLMFGGGFVLLLSLQGWATASQHRSRLPRTVKVSGGQLEITALDRTETAELKDCTWSAASSGFRG